MDWSWKNVIQSSNVRAKHQGIFSLKQKQYCSKLNLLKCNLYFVDLNFCFILTLPFKIIFTQLFFVFTVQFRLKDFTTLQITKNVQEKKNTHTQGEGKNCFWDWEKNKCGKLKQYASQRKTIVKLKAHNVAKGLKDKRLVLVGIWLLTLQFSGI